MNEWARMLRPNTLKTKFDLKEIENATNSSNDLIEDNLHESQMIYSLNTNICYNMTLRFNVTQM